ncbi:MAG TPA: molybdopterin-guanine dinucleotide biosynthesis protein B [Deltaproteobacteria bacterium]|nr:molybdopterin-guanine dinucleotide biosynthesis protein B [Deltaproteobacteria bacterium]
MVPVVAIVGVSGSGKTTLVEKVVAELTERGYRVGTLKHDVHGFDMDCEGKDSWRHKQAGAEAVVLSAPGKVALIKDVDGDLAPRLLASTYHSDMDIVIAEGFKRAPIPKIEVIRKACSMKPVCAKDRNLIAYVSDIRLRGRIPRYDLDDGGGVADLIEERFLSGPEAPESQGISLIVDGRRVTLKPFIAGLLRDAVAGMTRNLKGCEDPTIIELRIRRTDRRH